MKYIAFRDARTDYFHCIVFGDDMVHRAIWEAAQECFPQATALSAGCFMRDRIARQETRHVSGFTISGPTVHFTAGSMSLGLRPQETRDKFLITALLEEDATGLALANLFQACELNPDIFKQ